MKRQLKNIFGCTFMIAVLVLCAGAWFQAQAGQVRIAGSDGKTPAPGPGEAWKVAVVPFTVYAEKDLTFLQNGIVDMLASRLYQEGKVSVIGREDLAGALSGKSALNPETAAALGKRLFADYVLFGSLTVFGESVSVDAKMIEVAGGKPPLSFFTQSPSLGEVIPAIDGMATEINQKVFGRAAPRAAAPPPAPAPAAGQPRKDSDIYAHPETLIQGGFGAAGEQRPAGQAGLSLSRPWKSRTFKAQIHGIDLGDVDGDGLTETVIALSDKILIYRWENERFFQVAEIDAPGSRSAVGLDVADINENGIPEIFLSALNGSKNGVLSTVFEHGKDGYRTLVDKVPYFFRVVDSHSAFGPRLYGQRQKVGGDPFSSPIHRMLWEDGAYVPGEVTLRGGKGNALGFAVGSIVPDQDEQVLAYSGSDRLRVFDAAGGEIWKSGDPLGGSTLFLDLGVAGRGNTADRSYLPMRLRSRSLNREPGNEVIVAKNHEAAGRLLERFRNFNKTEIQIYSWDGIGLGPIWRTRSMSGHVRDFALGDFDQDGTQELVAALIVEEGRVALKTPKSTIITFDIVQTPAE